MPLPLGYGVMDPGPDLNPQCKEVDPPSPLQLDTSKEGYISSGCQTAVWWRYRSQ